MVFVGECGSQVLVPPTIRGVIFGGARVTEGEYLTLLLWECLFLVGGIVIIKGRQHSLVAIFWGSEQDGKTLKRATGDILLGLGVGILFFLVGWGISILTEQVMAAILGSEVVEEAQQGTINPYPPLFSPVGISLAIAGQYLLVGTCEEFFFRGVLFGELFPRQPCLGALVSAGAFTLYHVFPGLVPWLTLVVTWPYYFSIGLLFAFLVWIRHYNLLAPIAAHGTYNTILFILIYIIP